MNILDNVDRTIRRLFFEFVGEVLSKKAIIGLRVTEAIDTETSVFRVESLDAIKLRAFNRGCMKTPSKTICFTTNCVPRSGWSMLYTRLSTLE